MIGTVSTGRRTASADSDIVDVPDDSGGQLDDTVPCPAAMIDNRAAAVSSDRCQAGLQSGPEIPLDDTVLPSENILDDEPGMASSTGGSKDRAASLRLDANGLMKSGRSPRPGCGRQGRVSTGFALPDESQDGARTGITDAVKRMVSAGPDNILACSAHLGPPTDDFGAVGDATTGSHNIQRREHGMNADVRSKLEMAEHVRVFNRAHPASDTGTQLVFAQFDESIARANALITEQAQGNQRSRTANASRRELRTLLGVGLLRVIGNVCHAAAREDASLGTLKTPPRRAPNRVYIAGAEALVTGARARLEGLTKHGLTGELLDEAAKVVALYQAATEEASAAKQGRI